MKKNKALAVPFVLWAVLFIAVPLAMVVWYGVTVEETPAYVEVAGDNGQTLFQLEDGTVTAERPQKRTAVSLANFKRMLEPTYLKLLLRSLKIALFTTIICLLLGYPVALILSSRDFKRPGLWLMLIILPMWMNFLLRTYSWMSILENNGFINQFFRSIGLISFLQSHFGYSLDYIPLINTQGAIVLGMVYNFLPFMVLPIYTVLIKLDRKLIEAAQDLGAPTHLVFRRVIFPLSIPGVISGITMVFVPSVSTFVISQMLGSGKNLLVGDLIDLQFMGGAYNPHLGSAIALVMIILIFICMWIMNKFDDGSSEEGGLLL